MRVADVDRIVDWALHEPPETFDEVADVLERARLRAVAEHGDGGAGQRLAHEGWDRASVVGPHARSEGVEDPDDARVDPMGTVVGHRDRFAEPLGLVVHAARAHRIDVTPVVFALGVYQRIAVNLRGRGEQETRSLRLGHAERVVRAERADLQRLDRQLEVVAGRRRAGEVEHPVELAVEPDVLGDVVLDEHEAASRRDVGDVVP